MAHDIQMLAIGAAVGWLAAQVFYGGWIALFRQGPISRPFLLWMGAAYLGLIALTVAAPPDDWWWTAGQVVILALCLLQMAVTYAMRRFRDPSWALR